MKDQYFGDFGDYQKMSLLRLLSKGFKVTVYWMKTRDDEGIDGRHTAYLKSPELWRTFEPDVYDFVVERIATGKRLISHIETNPHFQDINFIGDYIEDESTRDQILKGLCADKTRDVVFFDPDNGIEVPSTNKKNRHKYVSWKEIEEVFASGKSVMVYQHFSRVNREKFIREKQDKLFKRIKASVLSLQVKHSVYFFILHPRHEQKMRKSLIEFTEVWKGLGIAR